MAHPSTVQGRRTVDFVLLVLFAASVAAPGSARGLDLRVRGKTELTAEARAAGTYLRVRGRLHDELGAPLASRRVAVDVQSTGSDDERVGSETSLTDARGRFSLAFDDLRPGQYRVRVEFPATSHLEGAGWTSAVAVRRAPVALSLRAPDLVVGRPGRVPLEFRATARGVARPAEVAVDVRGRARETVELGSRGRGLLDVAPWLETGRNEVVAEVVSPEDAGGSGASVRIDFARRLELKGGVEVVWDRLHRGLRVRGRVTADGEPVPDASVVVELARAGAQSGPDSSVEAASEGSAGDHSEEGRTQRVRTGSDGRFRCMFESRDLSDGRWRGRARVVPDLGRPTAARLGSVRLDRSAQRIGADLAAALGVVGFLLVAGWSAWRLVRRRWRSESEETSPREELDRAFAQEADLSVERVETDDPRHDVIAGRIWDSWRGEPVDGAIVESRRSDSSGESPDRRETDADGRFDFGELAPGRYELKATASAYAPGELEVAIPHDGRLDGARFELVPVRVKIRRMYESLARAAGRDAVWGRLSPREIEEILHRAARTAPETGGERPVFARRIRELIDGEGAPETGREYVEALRELVEETWFSDRRHGEQTWRLARRIAERIRTDVSEEGERE